MGQLNKMLDNYLYKQNPTINEAKHKAKNSCL